MLSRRILDLQRRNLLPAHIDDIIGTAKHVYKSFFICESQVICIQPPVHQGSAACVRHFVISGHGHIPLNRQPPRMLRIPCRDFLPGWHIHDFHPRSGYRFPDCLDLIHPMADIQENDAARLRGTPGIIDLRIRKHLRQPSLHVTG